MIENKKEFKLISKKNPRSLLPNTLTIFSVCLGLSSIKFALDANYAMSVIAIAFAAILDTLDGRVARLIKGTSKVGKELDSLTDVISFGVAPSFIMYFWAINEIGKIGWLFILIYTVCCALRLARFNLTTIEEHENWKINFFQGVPSPAAAGLVLMPLILSLSGLFQIENTAIMTSIVILITSILMWFGRLELMTALLLIHPRTWKREEREAPDRASMKLIRELFEKMEEKLEEKKK